MLSTHIEKQTKGILSETLFETIYRLAKAKEEQALTKIMESGGCIDIFQGGYSPILLLAKEGNHEAVEFLINKFGANLNDAVNGYANGGHADKVEHLISLGASLSHAVQGYARGGYVDKVKHLLSRGADLDFAVQSYAIGCYADQVEDLLSHGANISYAVRGYALGGHADKVEHLISRGASLLHAVQGYALGGHADKVEHLISRGASLNHAARGYAQGCYIDQVEDLLSRGASLYHPVEGYAQGGHTDQVEDLLVRGADIDDALFSYAYGGHTDKVEDLLLRGANLNHAIMGYQCGRYFDNQAMVLRILTFIQNGRVREKLAADATNAKRFLGSKALLAKATKLNQMMKECRISFNQAQSLWKACSLPELHIWFLQGIQLVKDKRLPLDIFIHIASFVFSLSNEDTQRLFNKQLEVVPKKLLDVSIERIEEKFNKQAHSFWHLNTFGSKKSKTKREEYLEEHKQAFARYQNRIF